MRRALLATLVVASLLAGGVFVRTRSEPGGRGAVPGGGARESPGAPDRTATVASPAPAGTPRGRPRSLRGTRSDGGLAVDADGRFVPTIDARRLFDYFSTASGEVPADALRARIVREIDRRLAPDAAHDATALLDRYLAYRERVRLLATTGMPDDGDLDARLTTLVALRREMLGDAAADAFFGDEEAEARRLLEARRITSDATLTVEERAARVEAIYAEIEADLPSDASARLAATLRAAEAEIRARGGDAGEVQALRQRLAGPEAAARLADLDRRRADWQGRVEAFRTARDRLEHDATMAPGARAAAVARLFAESFTPAEQLRVEALERIAAGKRASEP